MLVVLWYASYGMLAVLQYVSWVTVR